MGSCFYGTDMPPLMRSALLADKSAADGYNALPETEKRSVCAYCARMGSKERIDEFIRETDSFMSDNVICSGLRTEDPRCF